MEIERERKEERSVGQEYQWVKPRDMLKYYPKTKCDLIIQKRTERGIFKKDQEFPEDQEERSFPILVTDLFKDEKKESTTIKGKGTVDCDEDMANGLFGEGGLLSSSTRLNIAGLSEGATAEFWSSVQPGLEVAKQPKLTKAKVQKDSQDEPNELTMQEEMADLGPRILKEVSEARSFTMSLSKFDIAKDMCSQMTEHSRVMEAYYNKVRELQDIKDPDIRIWSTVKARIRERQEWYKIRQSVAKSMEA